MLNLVMTALAVQQAGVDQGRAGDVAGSDGVSPRLARTSGASRGPPPPLPATHPRLSWNRGAPLRVPSFRRGPVFVACASDSWCRVGGGALSDSISSVNLFRVPEQ